MWHSQHIDALAVLLSMRVVSEGDTCDAEVHVDECRRDSDYTRCGGGMESLSQAARCVWPYVSHRADTCVGVGYKV